MYNFLSRTIDIFMVAFETFSFTVWDLMEKKAQGAQRIDICSSGKLESIPLSLHFQCVDIHLLERRNTVGARYSYPFLARRRFFTKKLQV